MTLAALADAAQAFVSAARTAHKHGDADERDRFMDEADRMLAAMQEAFPEEPVRWRVGRAIGGVG